jgi:tetratricopeptide (TPR) repeat protein
MIYAQQGMVQRGLQCSDYALQKSAADALVWVLRGEVLTLAGNKNAEFCFTKAMETKLPDDWTIPAQVGMFLLREKHHAPAVEYLKAGVHLNTRNDFLWLNLGLALERLGIVQPALDAFNTALKLNPQNVEAEHAVRRLTSAPFLARFLRRFFG